MRLKPFNLNKRGVIAGIILLFLLFTLPLAVFLVQQRQEYRRKAVEPSAFSSKVILLVWDGAQRNHLNELLAAGKLPNLQKLINQGRKRNMRIFTDNCRCINDGDNYHTETGPGHAAMLTGYGFPQMKNHANNKAREEKENDCPQRCPPEKQPECFEKLGPNPIPRGRTSFERLKEFNPNIKTGLITGKDLSFFPFPAFKHAAPSSCCGAGGCGDGNAIDTCRPSNHTPGLVTPRFLEFLERNKNSPFFLFAHYKYPDSVGHKYGEDSQEYSNALIEDDRQTGKIVQKLKDLGIYEKTVILVTPDHGFIEKGHHPCVSETKNIWIVSNKRKVINRSGVVSKQTSVVPTIFDIFGIDKNVNPPFAGKSLFTPLEPTPTPTSTSTPTATPTLTPTPTPTPPVSPSPTPTLPPEVTPTPTPTPSSSPTPTPSPSPSPSPTPSPTPTPIPTPTGIPTPTPTPVGPTPTPPVHCLPLGDIDCSGKVNSLDYSYLIAHYNTSDPRADLDDSGKVNALDFSVLLANFGKEI